MAWIRPPLVPLLVLAIGCGGNPDGCGGSVEASLKADEQPEWHDCERNDVSIPCHAEHPGSGLIVHWRDGNVHRFTCSGKCVPNGLSVDEHGDSWQHELFIQGNSRYTNVRTGDSVFVPLRPPRARD
jgi:hypothetical protein